MGLFRSLVQFLTGEPPPSPVLSVPESWTPPQALPTAIPVATIVAVMEEPTEEPEDPSTWPERFHRGYEDLMRFATEAREIRVWRKRGSWSQAKAGAETALRTLTKLQLRYPEGFTEEILRDIEVCQICIGKPVMPSMERAWGAHAAFLARLGLMDLGLRSASGRYWITHCFLCQGRLNTTFHPACLGCGWIVCSSCGACGCGYRLLVD